MELKVDFEKEYCYDTHLYKTIRPNLKICVVCLENEIKVENGELIIWDRIEFSCGHQVHTRCGRRWHFIKNCIHCPICGTVKDTANNSYCNHCNIFGHYRYNCSKMLASIEN